MLTSFGNLESATALLATLVEECTKPSSAEPRPRAVFAVIGEANFGPQMKNGQPRGQKSTEGAAELAVRFSWQSGDATWTRAMDREPLSTLWRQALESRRVAGNDLGPGSSREVARVVAVPSQTDGEILGVLVAGLRHGETSLATLEGMELRAGIAAQALLARKRQREAEQQRDWESALLEADGDALVLLEPSGNIRKLSPKAQSLAAGQSGRNPASPERHFARIFQARERTRIEAWLERKANGSAAKPAQAEWLEAELASGRRVRLESIMAAGGGISAVRLKSLEESELRPQEKRAEAELRNVAEWLEEGVVLFDERQGIRLMNSRFAQMAGLTPEESRGTRTLQGLVERLANQTAEPEKFAARWLAIAHGRDSGVRDEVQLLLPGPRVLERATRPVLDTEGARLGRVEIYRDLTAQRVFHSKLIQTEKLAALGQMVTSIAHELNNPLTSILGYAQRLVTKNETSGTLSDAQQILHEAEHASTILKQLLLTARNSRPERRKTPLNQIVIRTVELQRVTLLAEQVQVELDLDSNLPFVLGDAGQLQQVLMNLIGNARQAIEQAGKPGTIRIRTRRAGMTHALLEVSDNGPGIHAAILARIFDPFFTTKPVGIGTGLGLSIVLAIVREHGGQVRVTSPPEGGATFSVELPVVPSEEKRPRLRYLDGQREGQEEMLADEAAVAGERGEAVLGPWAGSQVLVVEDEATVAQLIADVLKDEGLEVEVLLDGREALRRAATEDYDLVICDMKMPDLDGEQFYRRLSRTQSPLRGRVLFVTGDVLAAHARQFLDRHDLPHLAKPFRVDELTEKVQQVLMDSSPHKTRAAKR